MFVFSQSYQTPIIEFLFGSSIILCIYYSCKLIREGYKERMPKKKNSKNTNFENPKIYEHQVSMDSGFNSALTLCLAPIEELELEIKRRMR